MVGGGPIGGSVEHLSVGRLSVDCGSVEHLSVGQLSVDSGSVEYLSAGRWSVFGIRWIGGALVGGSVDDLSVGRWVHQNRCLSLEGGEIECSCRFTLDSFCQVLNLNCVNCSVI